MKRKLLLIIHYSLIIAFLFGGTVNAGFFDWVGSFFKTAGTDLHESADGLVGHWMLNDTNEWYGSELVTNTTMETDANWANTTSAPATNEQSTTQVHDGLYSRKFIPDAVDEGIQSDVFATVTGKMYRISAWVYPDDTTTVTVTVRKGDDSGDVYDTSQTGLTQDSWNELTINYTETAGGAGAYIIFDSGASSSGSWYVDNASIKELQASDSTSNENHGTLYQDATVYGTDRYETANSAMEFNGTSDYATIPDTANLDVTNITISAWVNPDTLAQTDGAAILCKGDGGGGEVYCLDMNDEGANKKPRLYFYESAEATIAASSVEIPAGQWSHLGGTFDGSTLNLYINGVVRGTASKTVSLDTNSHALTIGCRQSGSTTYDYCFNGKLQDVRVYNRALSAWEIKKLYEETIPDPPLNLKNGLIGRWTLAQSEETGGQMGDITESDLHGTITAGASAGYTTNHNSISNKAYDFDGSATFISMGNVLNFGTNDFSISAWFEMDVLDGCILAKGTYNGVGDFIIYDQASLGKPMSFRSDDAFGMGNEIALMTEPASKGWYNIVITRSGDLVSGYVNGVFTDSETTSASYDFTNAHSLDIGAREDGSSRYLNGQISDVRIYNRALFVREIYQLYNETTVTRNKTLTDGLIGNWTLANRDGIVTGAELITNGTMEADSNWADTTSAPATNEQSTTQIKNDTYSRKFVPDAANEGIKSDVFTTTTDKRYKVNAWVYPDDETTVTITVRKGDDSGDVYDASQTGLTQDSWNEISIYYTETAGGAGAYIVFDSGAVTSGSWYIDDASIKEVQATDVTGNENHGTVTGATSTTDHNSVADSAMNFNGTDAMISISDFDEFRGNGGTYFSAFAWVKSAENGTTQYILDHYNYGAANQRSWTLSTGASGSYDKLRVTISDDGTLGAGHYKQYASSLTVFDNAWHHIGFTWEGTLSSTERLKLFIDGAQDTSVTKLADEDISSLHNSTSDFRIGNTLNNGAESLFLTGAISNAKIYNRTLSPWEIYKLYNES